MPQTFTLGQATIELCDGYTLTRFRDGQALHARHDDLLHLGQIGTAEDLGYVSTEAMNRDHDLVHSLLAVWLGLEASPTLHALATGTAYPHAWMEEAAVLAIQRFLVALGRDAVGLVHLHQGSTSDASPETTP